MKKSKYPRIKITKEFFECGIIKDWKINKNDILSLSNNLSHINDASTNNNIYLLGKIKENYEKIRTKTNN